MVERTRPVPDVAEHALLYRGAADRRHVDRIRGPVARARARPQVRGDHATRTPPLRAHLRAGAAAAGIPDLRRLHRRVDGSALRRFARPPGCRHDVARRRLRQAALVLSLRPAVLRDGARLRAGAGDLLHYSVLGGRARLATAVQDAGPAGCARTEPEFLPPGRRP